MLSDDWNDDAKEFIVGLKEDIDVRTLFNGYAQRLEKFYAWYLPAVKQVLPADAADYINCTLTLKKFHARQAYGLLLNIFLQRKDLDPYNHLEKYFDPTQLDCILALPKYSSQQVDLIISFIDKHNVCDDVLRGRIYQLFKVNN